MSETSAPKSQIKLGSVRTSNKGLWIAIALGVVAGLANMIYVHAVQGTRLTVLKAKARLSAGTKVTAANFTQIDIFGDNLKEMKALLVEAGDLPAFSRIPLAESIESGQVLLHSSFTFSGNRGIRDTIGPDERAIAVQVKDETSAVAYFVRPGDVVDVWAFSGGGVQNIIPSAVVRAVGDATIVASDSAGKDARYRTITVVVKNADLKDILQRLNMAKNEVTLALAGSASR